MSNYTLGDMRTYTPAADMKDKQGFAVELDTTAPRTVKIAANAAKFLGVLFTEGTPTTPTASTVGFHTLPHFVTVQTTGTARAIANAAITNGAAISVAATGKFKVAAGGEFVVGYAENSCEADETFSLRIAPKGAAA